MCGSTTTKWPCGHKVTTWTYCDAATTPRHKKVNMLSPMRDRSLPKGRTPCANQRTPIVKLADLRYSQCPELCCPADWRCCECYILSNSRSAVLFSGHRQGGLVSAEQLNEIDPAPACEWVCPDPECGHTRCNKCMGRRLCCCDCECRKMVYEPDVRCHSCFNGVCNQRRLDRRDKLNLDDKLKEVESKLKGDDRTSIDSDWELL